MERGEEELSLGDDVNDDLSFIDDARADGYQQPDYGSEKDQGDDLRYMFTDEGEDDADDDVDYDSKKPQRVRDRGDLSPAEQDLFVAAAETRHIAHETNDMSLYEDAIESLQKIVLVDKRHPQKAFRLLADIYYEIQDYKSELDALTSFLQYDKRDPERWIRAGDLNLANGNNSKALHCYKYAARLRRNEDTERGNNGEDEVDTKAKLEIRVIQAYSAMGRHFKAYSRLAKLIDTNPTDPDTKYTMFKEKIRLLQALGRPSEAADYLESLLEEDRESRTPCMRFGFSELNMLLEIYYSQHYYSRTIREAKSISRWLQGREIESWWDEMRDDSEFDDRRADSAKYQEVYSTPEKLQGQKFDLLIDLRIKLLLARLKSGDYKESCVHLRFLLEKEPKVYADLYYDVAEAYEACGYVDDAYTIWKKLLDSMSEEDIKEHPDILYSVGSCSYRMGNIEEAEALYNRILSIENQSSHEGALIGLSEIYADRGDHAKSYDLYNKVVRLRENALNGPEDSDAKKPTGRARGKLMWSERHSAEKRATEEAQELFISLPRYYSGLLDGNRTSKLEWFRAASELVHMFVGIKQFFPADLSKQFTGYTIITRRTTSGKESLSEFDKRLDALQGQLESAGIEEDIAEAKEKFRGIKYTDWFEVFMQYALALAFHENDIGDSLIVLSKASEAITFRNDPSMRELIQKVQWSVLFRAKDLAALGESVRSYINSHKFYNDSYRLFSCLFCSGWEAIEAFNKSSNQKFFLRNIKGIDSILQGVPIAGSTSVSLQEREGITKRNPVLQLLYAENMLVGKSYVPSLTYLLEAYNMVPEDPMVLLLIGISYIHRAIQRQSNNRHLQLLEGVGFLSQYCDVRSKAGPLETQESLYNMGRAFQMIGLPSLALKYYDQILTSNEGIEEEYHLKYEAAYNMQLIYTISGNLEMARHIVDKWLTV